MNAAITIHKNTHTNNSIGGVRMIYRYSVSATQYGGEHTIGTITKDQAEYWLDRDDDELQQHISDDEGDENPPKQFRLGYWQDLDNILHANGVEYSSGNILLITDENTQNEIEVVLGNMEIVSTKTNVLEIGSNGKYVDKTLNDANKVLCYGQSFEEGEWSFDPMELNHPVDITKFRFNITRWDNLWLVDGIEYGDNPYSYDDGDTVGKSFNFWIDD